MLEILTGMLSGDEPTFRRGIPEDTAEGRLTQPKEIPKVLVVDDEKLIADTLTEILKRNGFNAIGTYGGEQALRVAKRFHPDYLLADVLMPSMNGVELAIEVRRMSAGIKILLFSGHAISADILNEARLDGYEFDVVAKPIHPEKLMQLLREKR